VIYGADFGWDPASPPTLAGVRLAVPAGALAIVVGEVGAGKSTLLAAILGEVARRTGNVTVRGAVALTAQDPWIQNDTVEGNILMGAAMDAARYAAVLEACALEADLKILPAGDQTEIGEKGVNLSGACAWPWPPPDSHSSQLVRFSAAGP
jgi:ABC-type bacteriocin/lantibiotic exporter with double-glycine peptidase domain